jgi:hypothetical protein
MAPNTLREILAPAEESDTLRWQSAVPLVTNPFLLFEMILFSFVGAIPVPLALCIGIRLAEGQLTGTDAGMALYAACLVFAGLLTGCAGLSVFFRQPVLCPVPHGLRRRLS